LNKKKTTIPFRAKFLLVSDYIYTLIFQSREVIFARWSRWSRDDSW